MDATAAIKDVEDIDAPVVEWRREPAAVTKRHTFKWWQVPEASTVDPPTRMRILFG